MVVVAGVVVGVVGGVVRLGLVVPLPPFVVTLSPPGLVRGAGPGVGSATPHAPAVHAGSERGAGAVASATALATVRVVGGVVLVVGFRVLEREEGGIVVYF